MKADRRKLYARILGWTSLAIWLGGIGLWFQYDGTRPGTPDRETGRTYQLITHSHYVYLTRAEWFWLYGILGIGWTGGMVAIATELRIRGKI
jgi:hypothetical protein